MDRITQLRIRNVRAIEHVDLDVSPLTVLIGENGSGKSTILECLEILRKAADATFFEKLYAVHRGMPGLLRKGARDLGLGVLIEDDAGELPPINYNLTLASQGAGAVVGSELLTVGYADDAAGFGVVLRRGPSGGELLDPQTQEMNPIYTMGALSDRLVIGSFGATAPVQPIERLLSVLRGVEVHLHFDTIATWAARSYQFTMSLRGSTLLQPTDRLSLLGFNFANAWAALKNQDSATWSETLALVRLGLGDDIDTVNVDPDAGGGQRRGLSSARRHGGADPRGQSLRRAALVAGLRRDGAPQPRSFAPWRR